MGTQCTINQSYEAGLFQAQSLSTLHVNDIGSKIYSPTRLHRQATGQLKGSGKPLVQIHNKLSSIAFRLQCRQTFVRHIYCEFMLNRFFPEKSRCITVYAIQEILRQNIRSFMRECQQTSLIGDALTEQGPGSENHESFCELRTANLRVLSPRCGCSASGVHGLRRCYSHLVGPNVGYYT